MPRRIAQGRVIIPTEGQHPHVIIDPETSHGNAMSSAIISDRPPELGFPATRPYKDIQAVLPEGFDWSQKSIERGLTNGGRYKKGDPTLKQTLQDGHNRGERSI